MAITGEGEGKPSSGATLGGAEASLVPEGLFARKSSGLVRELGIRDAFAVGMGSVSPTGMGFFFFVVLAGFPGTDLTWPLVIGLVGVVLLTLTYSQLTAAMPRSGADYVYTSRILHPALGSGIGLAFFLALLFGTAGVNTEVLANTYLPFVSATLGNVFHSHALTTFAVTLTEKGWTIGVSALVCLIIGWFLLRRVGFTGKVIFYGVALGLFAVIVLTLEFVFHSPSAFRHAYDSHLHNPRAYQQMIAAAHHVGVSTGVHTAAVLASVAILNFAYGGATFANYTGGELRKPNRTFHVATLATCGIAFLVFMASWLAMKHDLGLAFSQSSAYINTNDPTTYAKLAGDVTNYVPSYVLLIASNPVSKIIIAFGFAAGVFALVLTTGLVLSRLLFAMSFDRILPAAVADVRPKSHAPLKSTVLVTTLFLIVTIFVVYTSVLSATRNLGLVLAGIWAIASFAAAIMPWRRRDLYAAAPKMLGKQRLGVPMVTVIGGISCVYWLFALYLGATKTQVSGGYDTTSVIVIVATCLVGFVAYFVSRAVLRRKGLNLDLALHDLPPE